MEIYSPYGFYFQDYQDPWHFSQEEYDIPIKYKRHGKRIKAENYKTELCKNYEETGKCNYGSKCEFAHGKNELKPK